MREPAVTAAWLRFRLKPQHGMVMAGGGGVGQASRAISTARLHVLPRFHLPPINVLVSYGPSEGPKTLGVFILEGASHLDAFSGYPFLT